MGLQMLLNSEVKNIAFAKIGKSIKFKSKYSCVGGDNEASALLQLLANNNPDKVFWIIGRCDLFKLKDDTALSSLFKYDNVRWLRYTQPSPVTDPDWITTELARLGVTIDLAILMSGAIARVTIPGKTLRINDSGIATVIDMTRGYTTPIINWLNTERVPYIEIVNDPRCVLGEARDLLHYPVAVLSQIDGTYKHKRIRSFEDQTCEIVDVPLRYAGVETIFLYGRAGPSTNRARPVKMTIVLNEGQPSRYKNLQRWILDSQPDVQVWGQWSHPLTVGDKRFCGSAQLSEIQRMLHSVRYSFIIPIAPGWATSKYIELIHAGVIPFFHPDYATAAPHVLQGVPRTCRPETPVELAATIARLEANPAEATDLINTLQERFCPSEAYSGTVLTNTIMSAAIVDYIQPDCKQYTKVEPTTLAGFIA